MKLNCTVLVVYRTDLTTTNARTRRQISSLSFVLNPKDDKEVFIIHQTVKGNGIKYKITGNIENVFTKFLSSGKATIRLKVPAIDLCIECDSIQLKCFLQKLKAILQSKDLKNLKLMTVSSCTQVLKKSKTKLVIIRRDDYNLVHQFPRTLQEVQINNIMLSSVDSRILKLCNLSVLNLEKNAIECLPEGLGKLQINELYLGSNALGTCSHPSYWKWIYGRAIQSSLALLSLENNQLQYIPNAIVKLRCLVTLKLDNNLLKELPVTVGRLPKLSYLSVSSNKLLWLPSTLRCLRLNHLDFSHNKFAKIDEVSQNYIKEDFFTVFSLRERSGLAVIFHRLHLSTFDGDIPVTLRDFLSETSECCCRKPTFCSMPFGFIEFTPRLCFVNVINTTSEHTAIFKVNFCSFGCYRRSLYYDYRV